MHSYFQKGHAAMKTVGIIGASGYTGHELVKLLGRHESVDLRVLNSRNYADQKISSLYRDFQGEEVYTGYSFDEINALELDLIFLALPHAKSMDTIAALATTNTKLIDLSADYRFKDGAIYEKVYGRAPLTTEYDWVYGLPELFKTDIQNAHAVANPGCYATASILAAYPIKDDATHIIFDCQSGYSGAGRDSRYAKNPELLQDNLIAYSLTKHRHKYEIEQFIDSPLSFTPHVFNTFEGMMCTAHILLKDTADSAEIIKRYQDFYGDAAFVRVNEATPDVRQTQKTNFCDIGGFEIDETNQLVVVSSLDNLWKGAAGQAIQNMNLMLGFEETTGLV
jgi:N-acetyl-gamma-glutamyl-phosphate reductase